MTKFGSKPEPFHSSNVITLTLDDNSGFLWMAFFGDLVITTMLLWPKSSKTSIALEPISPKPRTTEELLEFAATASSSAVVARFSIDSVV